MLHYKDKSFKLCRYVVFLVQMATHRDKSLQYNQQDALISQIYFRMKFYMFRTVPLPIIRSFPLYTQQWYMSTGLLTYTIAASNWFHYKVSSYWLLWGINRLLRINKEKYSLFHLLQKLQEQIICTHTQLLFNINGLTVQMRTHLHTYKPPINQHFF
jgi:hypothetical protein